MSDTDSVFSLFVCLETREHEKDLFDFWEPLKIEGECQRWRTGSKEDMHFVIEIERVTEKEFFIRQKDGDQGFDLRYTKTV